MRNPRAILPLPYTRPPLSLNDSGASRGAAFAKARVRREIREHVCRIAALAYVPRGVAHVTVELHYQAPDRRRRDTDNLVATAKPVCDALTAGRPVRITSRGVLPPVLGYGMVPDDTPAWMSKPEPVIHAAIPGEPGRMWVELTWITHAEAARATETSA
ncbi:hypothetical protein IU433_14115 [Nocardia puris]|uniref:hypothetical protein n=1 Tax=Nocardia puris TaxID=208602 RepID=UPI0018954447|nr:hypothetical protein [Nocardia puris]MBF6460172.1 hypothetical protein [Nocardia puris]